MESRINLASSIKSPLENLPAHWSRVTGSHLLQQILQLQVNCVKSCTDQTLADAEKSLPDNSVHTVNMVFAFEFHEGGKLLRIPHLASSIFTR